MAFQTTKLINSVIGTTSKMICTYSNVWIGITTNGYIIRSVDGTNWTHQKIGAVGEGTIVQTNDRRILVFFSSQLYYSDDEGLMWIDGMGSAVGGNSSASFANRRYTFLVLIDKQKMYRSYDGLNPYEELDLPPYVNQILSNEEGVLVATTSQGGNVYRSTNNGNSWTTIGIPTAGLDGISLKMSAFSFIGNKFYIASEAHDRIYESTDEHAQEFVIRNTQVNNKTNPLFFAIVKYSDRIVVLGKSKVIASERGEEWSVIPTTGVLLQAPASVLSGQLFVASQTSGRLIHSNTIGVWLNLASGSTRIVSSIAQSSNRDIVLGYPLGYIQKYIVDIAPSVSVIVDEIPSRHIEMIQGMDIASHVGQLESFIFHYRGTTGARYVYKGLRNGQQNDSYLTGVNNIVGMTVDELGNVLYAPYELDKTLGTGTLIRLNNFLEYKDSITPVPSQAVSAITQDNVGNIYIGYREGTLIKLNRHHQLVWQVQTTDRIYRIEYDMKGYVYIGTEHAIERRLSGDGLLEKVLYKATSTYPIFAVNRLTSEWYRIVTEASGARFTKYDLNSNILWTVKLGAERAGAIGIDSEGYPHASTVYNFTRETFIEKRNPDTGERMWVDKRILGWKEFTSIKFDHLNEIYATDEATITKFSRTGKFLYTINGGIGLTTNQVSRVDTFIYNDGAAHIYPSAITPK